MKNITVSVDDEVYRQAKIAAAVRSTSVSALVRSFLEGLTTERPSFEELAQREKELRKTITGFSASDRLSRDELYDRGRK